VRGCAERRLLKHLRSYGAAWAQQRLESILRKPWETNRRFVVKSRSQLLPCPSLSPHLSRLLVAFRFLIASSSALALPASSSAPGATFSLR
jgi:hypothetical protein